MRHLLLFWVASLFAVLVVKAQTPAKGVDCSAPLNDSVRKCPENFYPKPKLEVDPYLRNTINKIVIEARSHFAALDENRRQHKELHDEEEAAWVVFPWDKRRYQKEAEKLDDEAKVLAAKAEMLADKAVSLTIIGYHLQPRKFEKEKNSSPRKWSPRYSEREIVDAKTGSVRRETREECEKRSGSTACFPLFGGTTPEGEVRIFQNSLLLKYKSNGVMDGGAERLAFTILHETIHWVDLEAAGGKPWTTLEWHEAEKRATRKQLEYGRGISKKLLSDDPLKRQIENQIIEWNGQVAWREKAVRTLEAIYKREDISKDQELPPKLIPREYRKLKMARDASMGPELGVEEKAELMKTESGRQFVELWDGRVKEVLGEMKAIEERQEREREDREARLKERERLAKLKTRDEAAVFQRNQRERLKALLPFACGRSEYLLEVVEIWNSLESDPAFAVNAGARYAQKPTCETWLFNYLLGIKYEDRWARIDFPDLLRFIDGYEKFLKEMETRRGIPLKPEKPAPPPEKEKKEEAKTEPGSGPPAARIPPPHKDIPDRVDPNRVPNISPNW